MESLSRETTASLLNCSTLLTSTPASALLYDGQTAPGSSTSLLFSPDVITQVNKSSSPRLSYQLSDDDRLHQHFSDQLDQYKRELASLQERAQQIVTENTTLRLEASTLRSRQSTQQSTMPRQSSVLGLTDVHVHVEKEPTRADLTWTTEPREEDSGSNRWQPGKDAKLDPTDSGAHSKGVGSAAGKGGASEGTAVPNRKHPSPISSPDIPGVFLSERSGQRIARVELELAQSRKENERLSKSLEDANKQVAQRLQEVLKLDTKLSVQDDNYKAREAEIKAAIPSLCVECRHRKALLPQPISTEHQRTISGLERERDDAHAWLKKLRERLGELQQKEVADQQHVRSTLQRAMLMEDDNEQMILEVSRLQDALQKKESDFAASLQAVRADTESAMRSREAQWQQQQEQLRAQVQHCQTTEIASQEEIAMLARTHNCLQTELRTEQQLRHTESENFKKRTSQLDSVLKELQANQQTHTLEHGAITSELGARNANLEKNLVEVQQQLSAHASRNGFLQQSLEASRERCSQVEVECAQCKQDALGEQLSHASALQHKDAEMKRTVAEDQRQLEEAVLKHSHFVKQSNSVEADLRQLLKEEKETSCHWKSQYGDVKERMNADIEKLRAKLSSCKASVVSLVRERDAAINDAGLLAAEVKHEGKRCRKLEATSKQSETDSQHWKHQVHTLLQKQRELMLERRNLCHQLELVLMKPSSPSAGSAQMTTTAAGGGGAHAGAVFRDVSVVGNQAHD